MFYQSDNIYTALGAMTYLDNAASVDCMNVGLKDYFEVSKEIIKESRYCFYVEDDKLLGYGVWGTDKTKPDHLCAPWGHKDVISLKIRNEAEGLANALSIQDTDGVLNLIGCAVELCSVSDYHSDQDVAIWIDEDFLPPVRHGQAKLYTDMAGKPIGLFTWAWLSDELFQAVVYSDYDLEEDEWNCGKNMYVHDLIAPHGSVRKLVYDMTHNVFPDEIAVSLRRNSDGSVRRVNCWTGVNVRN